MIQSMSSIVTTRRGFSQALLALAASVPIAPLRLWAQTSLFPGPHAKTLDALTAAILPSSLDSRKIAQGFVRWVHGYRPGADMEHGYGFTRMARTGPSPTATYQRQLAKLAAVQDLRAECTADFAALGINNLPQTPDGRHIAADLMAYWFRSADANDQCYNAAIKRDDCRGFATAGEKPGPLKGRA